MSHGLAHPDQRVHFRWRSVRLLRGSHRDAVAKNADALRAAQKSFAVPVVAESTLDISDRIYNNANDGGFK